MSYSRRQLYAMGEPLGDGSTRREVGGKIIYGGGGGGTPEKQTTIVDIPDYAKPYAKESLGKAAALSATPYQTYGGERIAQFTPLQKQAFGRAQGQEVASQIGAGSGLAGTAGLMGLTGGYQPGQFGSQMSQYMSPYMEAVTQRQMDSAQRQADIASTQRGAQAVRAGAFGGSRQAIENAEAARALASQKGQIQETGLQSAYDRATDMYGREQALAEQSRQAGLSTALGAAGQLGQLGQQQFGQEMDITGQQSRFGDQQRAATQDILSTQYQDFLNQQRAPYDQLSFMNSILRGTPMGQTTTQYQPPPNQFSQLAGLGIAGAGAYGAYQGAQGRGRAAGGEVRSYASGGKLNLEGTFEVGDGGGGLGSLGGGGMFNNMGGQGPLDNRPSLAVLPQNNSRPMDMMMRPAVMPRGSVYAAGGIASLNQPEMAAMAGRMSDEQLQQVVQSPARSEIEKLTFAAQQQQNDALREQSKAMQAKGSMSNITSTLANMPDEQLQQYAKLNKGDPYIMALVVAEADRRKKGGMPPEEAPTVVAQRIADMALPEDMGGIAQLDAGKMEFADGGIIAFQNGGAIRLPANTPAAEVEEVRRQNPGREVVVENAGLGALPLYTMPTGMTPEMAAASGVSTGTQELMGQRRTLVEETGQQNIRAAEANLAGIKKDQAEMGPIGAEREKRNLAQEKSLEGAEGKNFNMALIQAGLAIMAGNSANAFENIGKGAMVGTEAYTKGISRIQDRKEKLDESIARLDELRHSANKDDKAAVRSAMNGVNTAKTALGTALSGVIGEQSTIVADAYAKQKTRQATLDAANIAANKLTNEREFVDDYVKSAQEAGDPRPVSQLRVEGAQMYPPTLATKQRADISGTQALTAAEVADSNNRNRALQLANDSVQFGDGRVRFNALLKEDPTGATARAYRNELFEDALKKLTSPAAPARSTVPPPAAAPAAGTPPSISSVTGAPSGATIGAQTSRGWEVKDRSGKVIGYAQP